MKPRRERKHGIAQHALRLQGLISANHKDEQQMKICIFGLGAIGGFLAARLAHGGAEVSAVARPSIVEAIRSEGLLLKAHDGDLRVSINVAEAATSLGHQDAVIVAVKGPAIPQIAAGIQPLLGPDTAVVFALNGFPWWYFHGVSGRMAERRLPWLDPGDAVWNRIGPERAIGAVVYLASSVPSPGVVRATSPSNRVVLGEPNGMLSARVNAIAAALRAGGFVADVTPKIRDEVWDKLVGNMCTGPLAALALATAKDLFSQPACELAIRQVIAEASAIAGGYGCHLKTTPDTRIATGRALDHKPSMVQDLELGRPLEVDEFLTVPRMLAREMSIATPMLDLIDALLKLRARAAGLYRDGP